jgi:hypothetical protein
MRLCGTEGFSTSTSRKIEKIAEEEDPFVQRNSLEPVDEEKNIRLFICASLSSFAFQPTRNSRRNYLGSASLTISFIDQPVLH